MLLYRLSARAHATGSSMIEVLVSLIIIAFAMLGAVGLQVTSMKMSKGASLRTQAILLSTEIAERMETNKVASLSGAYMVPFSSTPALATADCLVSACTSEQLASYDIAEWSSRVTATLQGASWQITQTTAGNPATYQIVVNWEDRRSKTEYAEGGTAETFAYTATKVVHE